MNEQCTIRPARYAKNQVAISCPSSDGYKTRAARLCEHLNGRYSGRENAYIMSQSKAKRFEELYKLGFSATIGFEGNKMVWKLVNDKV